MTELSRIGRGRLQHWQYRIFGTVWITYFAYYLCRYNMPVAKKRLCETFSWGPEDIGIVFTSLTAMYAVGQFVNGQLADRFGSRRIATLGVAGSVAMNLAVFAVTMVVEPGTNGSRSALLLVSLFWGINGFFQSMGWTPMVRVMAYWFPVANRGKTMGLLGTCYQLGAAFASMLAIFLTGYYCTAMGGDWRSVFLIPSAMFAAIGLLYFILIRDQPEDVGLPPVDEQYPIDEKLSADNENLPRSHVGQGPQTSMCCGAGVSPAMSGRDGRTTILNNVSRTLRNPYLWIVAWAFFALDVNRYGFVNWLPAFLDDQSAGETSSLFSNFKLVIKLCIHPLAGSVGAITAGWATDRFFGGRRAPVIVILMVALGIFSIAFPYIDPRQTWLVVLVVAMVGFCTYGPHVLMVAHAAQDFGKKSGAAGAAGFIDAMGYVGASLAGWGAGVLIGRQGYQFTFVTFGIVAFVGALIAACLWKVGPETASEDYNGRSRTS